MSLQTPVAFIIFNRPDTTEQVFQVIRQAQPQKLFIIADGPRTNRPNEAEKCAATRDIVSQVDWECEVLTNYSDVNLGCKRRVSSGIDWVFAQVEEAIILEDDCLPALSFFQFCQTLLDRYRHDERIMIVSGNNFQPEHEQFEDSYYFSKYPHIWGWATWRGAWQHYDVEMSSWQEFRDKGLLKAIHKDPVEVEFWTRIFNEVANNRDDTWDQQWIYTCWTQSCMGILPSVNLISNIGFRDDATRTVGASPLANLKTGNIVNIKHPTFVVKDLAADTYTFEYVYDGKALKEAWKFEKTNYGKALFSIRNPRKALKILLNKIFSTTTAKI